MSIRTSPCQWDVLVRDCSPLDELDGDAYAPIDRDDVVEMATALLWNWTGKAFGLCEVEVRPCRTDCADWSTWRGLGLPARPGVPWVPQLIAGEWLNVTCGRCGGGACSCTPVPSIRLVGPVDSIVSVTVDGDPLDPSAYRVDDRTLLVRDDGDGWPACQDLSKPADSVGTWSVRYRWGAPVPKGGQIAAGVLACEMAKALTGKECSLPQRIQTVTREGVTVGILDAFEGLEAGQTGVWLVDSWVASVTRPPARAQVHSPDKPRRPSVTTYRGTSGP